MTIRAHLRLLRTNGSVMPWRGKPSAVIAVNRESRAKLAGDLLGDTCEDVCEWIPMLLLAITRCCPEMSEEGDEWKSR